MTLARKVFVASDHGGVTLKAAVCARLAERGVTVEDLGPDSTASVDYPNYAAALCRRVLAEPESLGILVCGTGLGMSIAANRFRGIRAALCHNEFSARMARQHNDANVLCLVITSYSIHYTKLYEIVFFTFSTTQIIITCAVRAYLN